MVEEKKASDKNQITQHFSRLKQPIENPHAEAQRSQSLLYSIFLRGLCVSARVLFLHFIAMLLHFIELIGGRQNENY